MRVSVEAGVHLPDSGLPGPDHCAQRGDREVPALAVVGPQGGLGSGVHPVDSRPTIV